MNCEVKNNLNKTSAPMFFKMLPKQVVYKEENGEASEVPYRLGRLDTELYRNKKIINTIYGKEPFIPLIEIWVDATDSKSSMLINIINAETSMCAKQISIRSQQNNISLDEIKELYNEIIDTLNDDTTQAVVNLIELLRSKDIVIEEYC